MKITKNLSKLFLPRTLMATLVFLLCFVQAVTAAKEQPQWQGRIQERVNGSTAKQVWPLLQDFCDIYKIFPNDLSFCVEGVPGQTGQRRYMASKLPSPSDGNATFVSWEKHNLVALDPIKRYLSYEMMENNQGIKRYRSTMTVLGDKYGSQIRWAYMIDPVEGYTHEQFRAQLVLILQQAVEKIEKYLQST